MNAHLWEGICRHVAEKYWPDLTEEQIADQAGLMPERPKPEPVIPLNDEEFRAFLAKQAEERAELARILAEKRAALSLVGRNAP